jgi:hypothetical protein
MERYLSLEQLMNALIDAIHAASPLERLGMRRIFERTFAVAERKMRRPTRKEMWDSGDSICRWMVENVPEEQWTRENYLRVDHMGFVSEVDAEEEAELPEFFQLDDDESEAEARVKQQTLDVLTKAVEDTRRAIAAMRTCANCHVELQTEKMLCDVCNSMLDSVCRPWFHAAQEEWLIENEKRAQRKRDLLSGKD